MGVGLVGALTQLEELTLGITFNYADSSAEMTRPIFERLFRNLKNLKVLRMRHP